MEHQYNFIKNIQEEVLEIPPDSIISRTVHQDESVKVVLFGFAPGQELSDHTAAFPAIIHILDGESRLTLANESIEASGGSWTWMPANMPHSVYAKTQVKMLLLLLRN
jgi:quercetin dioxygenase-like cupin family protein